MLKNKNSAKSTIMVCVIGAVMLMSMRGVLKHGNIYKIPKT